MCHPCVRTGVTHLSGPYTGGKRAGLRRGQGVHRRPGLAEINCTSPTSTTAFRQKQLLSNLSRSERSRAYSLAHA